VFSTFLVTTALAQSQDQVFGEILRGIQSQQGPTAAVAFGKSPDPEKAHPIMLKIGDSVRWSSPCHVVFSDVTTYQGTTRYKLER
jgi:hypothetical protein